MSSSIKALPGLKTRGSSVFAAGDYRLSATRTRRMPPPINESGKILLVVDPPRQRGQTA
ncbi:MAG: hypothetical protein F6K58_29935 [Symploca sp. SIO2E9]|nr:hypothetical protein [Symploca sp. SIO2E9]